MAIRDEHGNSLGHEAHAGVTVRREVVETTSFVEVTRGVEKTKRADGALTVEQIPVVSDRVMPRGQLMGPDGAVRSAADGKSVWAPTDVQLERAQSAQRDNAAHEADQEARRTHGLSDWALARHYYNDGSVVRDDKGRIISVCGNDVERDSPMRQAMRDQPGVF